MSGDSTTQELVHRCSFLHTSQVCKKGLHAFNLAAIMGIWYERKLRKKRATRSLLAF